MLRYIRLYASCVAFSVSRSLEFRVDFVFRIAMDGIFYAASIAFFQVLFGHTALLGDWQESQVMVFVGAYLVVDAIKMTLFSNNIWAIPLLVKTGELDYYLTRPVPSLPFLLLRDFSVNSLFNLLMAIGVLAWALSHYPGGFRLSQVLVFAALLLNGAILHALVHMLFVIPVFWLQSVVGLTQMFFGIAQFMERPDGLFSGWVRIVMTTSLPFFVMASFPSRIIFEGIDVRIVLHCLSLTLAFGGLVSYGWNRGIRSYTSASS